MNHHVACWISEVDHQHLKLVNFVCEPSLMRRLQSALMALTINQVSIVCMHESRVFLQCLSNVTVISKLLKGHSTAKHRAPAYSRAGHQLIHRGHPFMTLTRNLSYFIHMRLTPLVDVHNPHTIHMKYTSLC